MKIGKPVNIGIPPSEGVGVSLCVTGRRENRYAREFVEHYRRLGFDRIYLCDNNREGEEYFEDVLQDYIDSGFVVLLDYRDRAGIQCRAYDEVYKKYGHLYEWMAFFDFDEFLTLEQDRDIHSFMKRFGGFSCVLVNWKNYGDCGLLTDDGRDVQERFTTPLPLQFVQYRNVPENYHIKSIVRCGIKGVSFGVCPHFPYAPKLDCCDTLARSCSQRPFQRGGFDVAYLKHFVTKTTEEYFTNKWTKGAGTHRNIEEFRFRYSGRFFKYNEWTEEKEQLMRRILGMPKYKAVKHRNVLLINYNTQRLTDCAIRSLNLHTPGCRVYVFDNSDREKFVNTFGNVEVIDNTRGQVVDFSIMLESYPDRVVETWAGSNYGSAKHCKSVDVCLDLIPEGFLLMDSDILITKDITSFYDASCPWAGLIGSAPSRWGITVPRVLPYLCYINAPMLRKNKIRYFNGEKMYALTSKEPEIAYDTGAWLYEACEAKGLHGYYKPIDDYMLHFDHGSWAGKDAELWLEENKEHWTND